MGDGVKVSSDENPRGAPASLRMDARLDALQKRLGHRFVEQALLIRALTHRSFGADHNERLGPGPGGERTA